MKLLCLVAGLAVLTATLADPNLPLGTEGRPGGIMPGVRPRPPRDNTAIVFPGSRKDPVPSAVVPGPQPEPARRGPQLVPVTSDSRPVPARPGQQPRPESHGSQPQPVQPGGQPYIGPVLELPDDLHTLDIENLHRLNAVSDINDFMAMFNLSKPKDKEEEKPSITTRFGNSGEIPAEDAVMANCKPELTTVALDLPVEPSTLFFPTCVRLEQCGGCCYGPLLTCRPTVTKLVKYKVLKTSLVASEPLRRRRLRRQNEVSYHVVEAYKHTECSCGCKVQETDCDPKIHTYFEGECACVCTNSDEKTKCEEQNSTKYWDNQTCNCYCRKPQECSSGEYFSPVSCSCERLEARSGFVASHGRREGDLRPDTSLAPTSSVLHNGRHKPTRVPLYD